jgi:hypothetical protein
MLDAVGVVVRISSHLEELSVSLPRLRAPVENGQILAAPPLDEIGALLEANRRNLNSVHIFSIGKSLAELRALARREVVAASSRYHRDAEEPVANVASDVWLVAGHQPELFHPGVWFKNFALHQLALKHGATALNLVVDTDAARPALLHAPADGRLARVPYDRSSAETPYEERFVEDETAFAELPKRMEAITAQWDFEPMLASFWRDVMKQAGRTRLLGERLAAARRTVERRWGCVNREAAMSLVCQTEAFAWFAGSVLAELPAFHAIYNQTVQDYRREHGIRSRSHPVPDLTADGEWLEAPFWAWRKGQTRRGKLFARRKSSAWDLRVAGESWPSIPHGRAPMVEAWRALETQGFKIRSRALTTTMFARLFLADVFIHGIGGGTYDELTDRLIERYFAIPAPAFLVLSATLLLPLPRYPDATKQVRALEQRWRDLVFKPERFVEKNDKTEPLARAKQEWIARAGLTHEERVERYHRIREINARLLPYVLPQTQRVQVDHLEQQRRAEQDEIAARRDYAFCLYPEEMLRTFFLKSDGAPHDRRA